MNEGLGELRVSQTLFYEKDLLKVKQLTIYWEEPCPMQGMKNIGKMM